jgi:hypothetical protein
MVVTNLDHAKKLAYGSHKGNKIVTMCGKMIDEFGLISVKKIPIKGLIKLSEKS